MNIKIEIPRSISIRETITNIDIHFLSDASINGVCPVAYAVIMNKISQGLITSKSRLPKRNLIIPHLELKAAQMSTNQNIKSFYAWSDSIVVLHWLKDKREYKVFESNRLAEIREHGCLEWKDVPIRNNPADLSSQGCELRKLCEFW